MANVKRPVVRRNPRRETLLAKLDIALRAHAQREEIGDMRHLHQAWDLNEEFVERSRGKSKARHGRFIKSVANQRVRSTYFPPEKRNGAEERERRLAQGK